jgi:NAD(P)-dependent dehydrogenase (short-subunit alcohol dehydrogenase family)
MAGRLANKVALVVAAGGTIGPSVPYLLAREGANVVVSARRMGSP